MLETYLAWNGLMAKTGERQSRALCEDRRQAIAYQTDDDDEISRNAHP